MEQDGKRWNKEYAKCIAPWLAWGNERKTSHQCAGNTPWKLLKIAHPNSISDYIPTITARSRRTIGQRNGRDGDQRAQWWSAKVSSRRPARKWRGLGRKFSWGYVRIWFVWTIKQIELLCLLTVITYIHNILTHTYINTLHVLGLQWVSLSGCGEFWTWRSSCIHSLFMRGKCHARNKFRIWPHFNVINPSLASSKRFLYWWSPPSPSATDISSIQLPLLSFRAGDRCIPQWLHRMDGLPIRRDAGQVGGSCRGRLHNLRDILQKEDL